MGNKEKPENIKVHISPTLEELLLWNSWQTICFIGFEINENYVKAAEEKLKFLDNKK